MIQIRRHNPFGSGANANLNSFGFGRIRKLAAFSRQLIAINYSVVRLCLIILCDFFLIPWKENPAEKYE